MQYIFSIDDDATKEPAYGTPEFNEMMGGYLAANERMKSDGVLRAGEGLRGIETATSLRIRSGKAETMDGPFAETREYLGGYYVIDVPNLDTALSYAALTPSVHYSTIEVRPLMDYNAASA